jgi:hypothetical protein
MKNIVLIFSLLTISYNCKAQDRNTINSNELTINGVNYLGENISFVTQNLGQPFIIEDYYFEMDDVMSKKYNYKGILFYFVNNKVNSFEITGNSYSFTNNNIKVGDNIEILSSIFPLSFTNKRSDSIGLLFDDMDNYVTIFFNTNNQITMIRMGSF